MVLANDSSLTLQAEVHRRSSGCDQGEKRYRRSQTKNGAERGAGKCSPCGEGPEITERAYPSSAVAGADSPVRSGDQGAHAATGSIFQKQINTYQARVQASPDVEQEYKLLTRDHQVVLDAYDDMVKRRDQSEVGQRLVESQKGEQFMVLDPANLPDSPSFPKLPLFAGGGFGAGLLLGLGLTFLLEVRDTSMRSDRDVEVVLRLPVLAMIPILTDNVGKGKKSPSILAS